MLGVVWELLETGKDAVVGRLTAHRRNADNLRQMQEKVWELEAQVRALSPGYAFKPDPANASQRFH